MCLDCRKGHYLRVEDCLPCSLGCLACSGSSSNCSSCQEGYTLDSQSDCYNRWSLYYLIGTIVAVSLLFWGLIAFAKCLVGESMRFHSTQPVYPESILPEEVYHCVSPVRADVGHIGKTSDRQDLSGVDQDSLNYQSPPKSTVDVSRRLLQYLDAGQISEQSHKIKHICKINK